MSDEEEDFFECDKFNDCRFCKHRFEELTCEDCDIGEHFEEEDIDEVDKYFQGRM